MKDKKERIGVMSSSEWFRRIETIEKELSEVQHLMKGGLFIQAWEQLGILDNTVDDCRTVCSRLMDEKEYLDLPYF